MGNHIASLVMFSALLVGCASSQTPYAPATDVGDVGYSESQLSADRYRVSYTGKANTSLELVQDYALLRAAELTVAQNYDWFEVVDRTAIPRLEEENSARAAVELSAGTPAQTRCGLIGCTTTQSSPNFPRTSMDFPSHREHFVASIEVLMGNGEHERSADIYEAREVISSIRANF
ncbi:MAG: CC0125/CC1285 family lipoprotein [Gammaproteobacteria bacterium]